MDRTLTARFYTVAQVDDNKMLFEDALGEIDKLPLESRERETYDQIGVWLSEYDKKNGLIFGQLTRAQKDNLPFDVSHKNRLTSRDMSTIKGIGHSIVFVYHPKTKTILVQIDNKAVSLRRFDAYLSEFHGISGYAFDPIYSDTGYERAFDGDVKKIIVRLSRPENLSVLESEYATHGKNLADLKKYTGAPYIEVSLGMGKRPGGLRKANSKGLLKALMGSRDDIGLRALKIIPEREEDEEKAVVIDLLKNHLKETTILDLPGDDAAKNYKVRLQKMISWFEEKREWLQQLQGQGN